MAYNSFTKTTFMAGPDEAQSAADTYSTDKTNAITLDKIDYSLTAPDSAVGLKIKPPELQGMGLKPPIADQASMIDRMIEGGAANGRSVKNCFGSLGDMAKAAMKIPGQLYDVVESTVNGVVTKLKGLGEMGLGDLKGIGCLTNGLTDGNYKLGITDKGGLSGMIAGVTNLGNTMGINNIFSSISNTITDKDILMGACKSILPNATKDFGLLGDLANTGIGSNLKSLMPSIAGNSIQNFRINSGTNNFQLPSLFNNISSTLNTIDSSWNNITRNGSSILSGVNLTGLASTDFHDTMEQSVLSNYQDIPSSFDVGYDLGSGITMPSYSSDESYLMLTKDIPEQSVNQCLANDFPTLPITVNPETLVSSTNSLDDYFSRKENLVTEVGDRNSLQIAMMNGDYVDSTYIETTNLSNGDTEINVTKFNQEGNEIIERENLESVPDNRNSLQISFMNQELETTSGYPVDTYLGSSEKVVNGVEQLITKYQGPGSTIKVETITYDINGIASDPIWTTE